MKYEDRVWDKEGQEPHCLARQRRPRQALVPRPEEGAGGFCRGFGKRVSASSLIDCFLGGTRFLRQRRRREEGRFAERTKKVT